MNIRTRAKEKHWRSMCKAGHHDWEFIGEFVRDPIVDCSSIVKMKAYQCTKCKAFAEKRYLNPYRKSKEAD
jgi:hypothetical protein